MAYFSFRSDRWLNQFIRLSSGGRAIWARRGRGRCSRQFVAVSEERRRHDRRRRRKWRRPRRRRRGWRRGWRRMWVKSFSFVFCGRFKTGVFITVRYVLAENEQLNVYTIMWKLAFVLFQFSVEIASKLWWSFKKNYKNLTISYQAHTLAQGTKCFNLACS